MIRYIKREFIMLNVDDVVKEIIKRNDVPYDLIQNLKRRLIWAMDNTLLMKKRIIKKTKDGYYLSYTRFWRLDAMLREQNYYVDLFFTIASETDILNDNLFVEQYD